MKKYLLICMSLFLFWACAVNTQKGSAVGFVTHLTHTGVFWKSYELELNRSQTGMTSTANELNLSIDNEHEDTAVINTLDSAQTHGWKIEVDYEEKFGTNCACNRGETACFIKKVKILDRTPLGGIKGEEGSSNGTKKDTIYVVIKSK